MDILTVVKQVALSLLARRKRWVIIATVLSLVVLLPLAWIVSKEPPRWRTSAVVLIETRADRTPLFQEFSPNRALPVQLAILQSRILASSVIEALPRASVEDLIENPYARDYWMHMQNFLRRLQGLEPLVESPQRRALLELQTSRVRFQPQGNSGVVEVRAEASKPRVALDIANTYVDVLLARTRSFNVDDAKSTREYLAQQHAQVAEALQTSEDALRSFTLSRGGIRIPDRSAETAQRLSQLETTLAEVQANKNISHTRLQAMRQKLEAMPALQAPAPRPAPPSPAAMANAARLRAKLASLEAQLVEARARYAEDHPRVRSLGQQIGDVQQELGQYVRETTSADLTGSSIPAQDRAAFADMVAALETSVVSLQAQESAIKEQVAALRRSLTGLSKDELEYRRLAGAVETNRKMAALLAEKLGAARIREQGEMNTVKVIDPPSYPVPAPNEKRLKLLGVALALSFLIGIGAPGVAEYFNRPVQTEEDVRRLTNLPVVAAIPRVQSRRLLFSSAAPTDEAAHEDYSLFLDAFRRLRVELQLMGEETPLRRLLVASSLPGEGKSTVVFNLALAFSEVGRHVIIADADFHRPSLHRTAKTKNEKGFTDLLAGTSDLQESLTPISDRIRLTPRGASLSVPARTGLGTRRLNEIIQNMAEEAEYVLLDSSPVLLIPDNLYIAAAVDGILLVVNAGTTSPRDLLRAKALIDRTGTPILGVVLNRVPLRQVNSYYRHYVAYYKA